MNGEGVMIYRSVIYERNKNLNKHKQQLECIRNRPNIYEGFKDSFSVNKKKSLVKHDYNKQFDEAFGNRYLFNRLTNISTKEVAPLQCSSLESRIMDQQKKVLKYQKDLKEKNLKMENCRLFKRIDEKAPFMDMKQLDEEYKNEHLYLLNNIKKVRIFKKDNISLTKRNDGDLILPSINRFNAMSLQRYSRNSQPFERIDASENSKYLMFNTEI